jgi:hypothetical protein
METVHWEMAAKFYLMVDGIEDRWLDLRAFVGPNLVDRLGDKLDHIVRRQLPLGRTAEAKAALGHAIDRARSICWAGCSIGKGDAAGAGCAGYRPDHQRGWWSTLDAWMGRASGAGRSGEWRGALVPPAACRLAVWRARAGGRNRISGSASCGADGTLYRRASGPRLAA